MKFTFAHNNLNVLNLERSLVFYRDALDLKEVRRIETPAFTLVYLGDGASRFVLELTWVHDRKEKYDLGDNETHLAFAAKDYDAAYALHRKMGCICHENAQMGIYFIEDPDGYWLEVIHPPRQEK